MSKNSDDNGCGCLSIIILALIGFGISKCNETPSENKPKTIVTSQTTTKRTETFGDLNDQINCEEAEDPYINNRLQTGAKPYKDYYKSRSGDNYLDFNTSGSDFVIIVKDYRTDKVVNHIYVRADDRGRLYLPNGTYNIFFYSGKGWNPEKNKGAVKGGFVSGEYLQKDGPVELYDQYGEYTLYPVQNGNLTLEHASVDEAF